MFNIPTELTLNVLSYLPFPSLSRLRAVCKSWNEFCICHENTIYRNAACLYAYIPHPTTMLNQLGSLYSQRALEGVNSWKDLVQKRLGIQRNWRGKGPSTIVGSTPFDLVHRIKVDELAGYIITTSKDGGLLVTDLNGDRILWSLPSWYVRQYAHLEYGQGYMIFDRNDGDKEVWRRLSDIPDHVVDGSSAPDAIQREVYDEMYESQPSATHGHFKPWSVLHMPEPTSAFRFVYPTLLVAANDCVYLWDIPSAKLVQTIKGFQYVTSVDDFHEYLGRIKYVEISDRHVFLVGQFRLRVYSRATGKSILDLPSSNRRYGYWKYVPVSSHCRTPGSALVRYEMTSSREPFGQEDRLLLYDKFVSVHVSACGCHFVALLSGCRLLVVYDFEKISGGEELYTQTLDIQIASHRLYESIYLAFDYGRIAVVTTNGVFIIEVDESTLDNILNEAPSLTVHRVFQLNNETSLEAVSCLMMSDTGLYLNWNPSTLPDEDEEGFEPWSENDYHVLPSGNLVVTLPHTGGFIGHPQELPHPSLSSVFSVNFARSS